ncbi:hypothetical protein AVEN_183657-1 [Araneus ventricosus]|uniref:Uncharacterized protein n=1 Tax=Araneus ventricosus TaxID=182803 RepID=A0A4Y2I1K2_ARAVE|nr:hypothetical protein AVEN_183657-1 [Araneus ventricosus]
MQLKTPTSLTVREPLIGSYGQRWTKFLVRSEPNPFGSPANTKGFLVHVGTCSSVVRRFSSLRTSFESTRPNLQTKAYTRELQNTSSIGD